MARLLAPTRGRFSLTSLPYYRSPLGAVPLHSLFLYSDTPPPSPSSFRSAETSFETNPYLYKHPSNLVPVILLVHTTLVDGTVFRNVGT
jgi:hypothetical protein